MRPSTIVLLIAAPIWALSTGLMIDHPTGLRGLTICVLAAAALITIAALVTLAGEPLDDDEVTHVPEMWAERFGAYATRLAQAAQAERARLGALYQSRPEVQVPALVSADGRAADAPMLIDVNRIPASERAKIFDLGRAAERAKLLGKKTS